MVSDLPFTFVRLACKRCGFQHHTKAGDRRWRISGRCKLVRFQGCPFLAVRYKLPRPTLAFEPLAWLSERCVWWVQLSPCSTPPPTESKSERLSLIKAPQSWSCVYVRGHAERERGRCERGFHFQKPLSSVYWLASSFQKVLREATTQTRGCKEVVGSQGQLCLGWGERSGGGQVGDGSRVEEEGVWGMEEQSSSRFCDCQIHLSRETVISWLGYLPPTKSPPSHHAASSQIQGHGAWEERSIAFHHYSLPSVSVSCAHIHS